MKIDIRRQRIARFLLTIYLVILSASAFHVHEHVERDFVCQDCVSHAHHSGHITSATPSVGECTLCEFFTTSYLTTQILMLSTVIAVGQSGVASIPEQVLRRSCLVTCLRAPPCF